MLSTYPSPCDTCPRGSHCIDGYIRRCDRWLKWFRWHWKQFNLYAKKHGIEPTTKEVETND